MVTKTLKAWKDNFYLDSYLFLLFPVKQIKSKQLQLPKKNTTKVIDSVKPKKTVKQEKEQPKELKDKLKGVPCSKAYKISEFKNLSIGGHSIGDHHNGYEYKGKMYSLKTIQADYDIVKYIVFDSAINETNEKNECQIVDLLEVSEEQQKLIVDENAFFAYNVHQNGKKDPELFAFASYNKKTEELTNIYHVWRTNRETEKIEEIKDLSNIKVLEEDEEY